MFKMKYLLLLLVGTVLVSCGTRVPFTNAVVEEFGLDNIQAIKKVQFITSTTIILEKTKKSGNQSTDEDGKLVTSTSKDQNRIIIPSGTKCLFDSYGPNGELIVRFEVGQGKILTFSMRKGSNSGRFYLVANWDNGTRGGTIEYGNDMYIATDSSSAAYLQVLRKKLDKTKRKDRVVKGMKV